MRKKEERNIRIVIKVNPSVNMDLDAFSKMMSIPKSTLVSIILIDGYKQCQKGAIPVHALYSPSSRALKEAKSSCSIKISIAEDIYGEINKLIDELNNLEDDPINMQSLFLGLWLWYKKKVFWSLHFHIPNFNSKGRKLKSAVDSFYKNKAIDYGVPVSNLQSFYLAQLLSEFLSKETEIEHSENRKDTKMFLDPFDIE